MSRRILFVIDSLFPLGPARQLNLLARQLTLAHFDVHIAAPEHDPFLDQGPMQGGVTVHPLARRSTNALGEFGRAADLKRLFDELQPEIVHSWCGAANVAAGLALRGVEKPRYIATELSEPAQPGTLATLARRRLPARPERLVVPHECLKQSATLSGIREHRIVVVPNAATYALRDRAAARRKLLNDFKLPDGSKIAITVAPLTPRTRLKDLIWATDLLVCVRDDVHFIILGSGPSEWRLRKFSSQTESDHHVHFAGEPPAAYQYLAGADFYWHSHLQSPLPDGLLSAMFNGIPAISVYGDGTKEIIRPQETGLATNFGARDEFARWTRYLIEQEDSATQLASQGQAHVSENFKAKPMVDGYLAIYNWCV